MKNIKNILLILAIALICGCGGHTIGRYPDGAGETEPHLSR